MGKKQHVRISILDSFRALAILAVLFYHFFTRWTFPKNKISLYPYDDSYNFFEYGHLGVEFFFIISGFVIFFTLEKTSSFLLFWKKRFIRLLPPIFVASILTYLIVIFFDTDNIFNSSHSLKNFIPSLTFISPQIFVSITGDEGWGYIDGSYWSLWPEVQFYLISSLLFFMNRGKFVNNYIFTSTFLIVLNTIVKFLESRNFDEGMLSSFFHTYELVIDKGFNIINYLTFFSLGLVFYVFYKKHQQKEKVSKFELLYFSFLALYALFIHGGLDEPLVVRVMYGCMILLFLTFVYYPQYLKIFENKFLIRVGISSYFLYLIHQNIGVIIIHNYGAGSAMFGFILPLVVTVILIYLSLVYSEKYDRKIGSWLRSKLLK